MFKSYSHTEGRIAVPGIAAMNKTSKGKGKANPLQAWTGPEGSKSLRLTDFKKSAHEGGKVVSPTHQPPLPPGNIPGTHFCYRLSRPPGP